MSSSKNELASQIWGTLKDNGFSDESAAGVLANVEAESNFNPTVYGCNNAYGLFQFDPQGALPGFKSYCSKNNYSTSSAAAQTKYMLTRLSSQFKSYTGKTYTYSNGTTTWWPEKMTVSEYKNKMGGSDGAALCAEIFCRVYERPSVPHMDTRKSNARSWYKQFTGTSGDGSGAIGSDEDVSSGYNPYAFQYTLKGSIFDPEVVRATISPSTKSSTTTKKSDSKSTTKVTYPTVTSKSLGKITFVKIQYSSKSSIGTAFNKNRNTNSAKWSTIHSKLNNKEKVWIGVDRNGDLHYTSTSEKRLKEIVSDANKKITGDWYVVGHNKGVTFAPKSHTTNDHLNSYYYEKIITAENSGKSVWVGLDDNGGLHYSSTSEDTLESYVDKANGKIQVPAKDDPKGEDEVEPNGDGLVVPVETPSTSTVKYKSLKDSNMIDNYIYLYHEDVFIVLPTFVEQLSDTMSVSFASSQPLGRSAPIYSYTGSGPRSLQFTFDLHRDMMTDINYRSSNAKVEMGDDYVDTMINYLQAMAVPKYGSASKNVNPPMVAIRMGDDIFIKGIISGSVSITYKLPILRNNKYSNVSVSFSVDEVDPYSAGKIMKMGSLRGISTQLESKIWR